MNANIRNYCSKSGIKIMTLKLGVLAMLAALIITNIPDLEIFAAGTITGKVFRDFDGDGVDDGTLEPGVSGITVSAYNPAGTASGTATTAADGTYSLSATGTGPFRIEFTGIPSYLKPSARSTGSVGAGTTGDRRFDRQIRQRQCDYG